MKGHRITYSAEELEWVKNNCTLVIGQLHDQFCARFNRSDVSAVNLNSLRKRNGWLTGRTGRFQKGHNVRGGGCIEANKTSFTKGHVPANRNPLYHERVCKKEGYVWIKVPETCPHTGRQTCYRLKHIWLWEKQNGKVPKGHALVFLDGDKTNCDPENLELVHRGVLAILNRHLRAQDYAPEMLPTLIRIAKLDHAANKKETVTHRLHIDAYNAFKPAILAGFLLILSKRAVLWNGLCRSQ